jgi:preprotein translocase subunit YajC
MIITELAAKIDISGLVASQAFAMGSPGGDAGPMGAFGNIMPLILMFVIFYFFLIRPQQKKAKTHRTMLENMKRGDEIILGGGMKAKVTKIKEGDEEIEAEISSGVKVNVIKSTVLAVVTKGEPTDGAK